MTIPDRTAAQEPDAGRAEIVEAIPVSLFDAPLDYIFADHFRQRRVCAALKRFADDGQVARAEADAVLAFLGNDLSLHHEDEDQDLFPALQRRALPDDNLGAVIARLSGDHRESDILVSDIVKALSAASTEDPVRLDSAARRKFQAYAASESRHLAMENGIVLALARIRLKTSDLQSISRSMRRRRGIDA